MSKYFDLNFIFFSLLYGSFFYCLPLLTYLWFKSRSETLQTVQFFKELRTNKIVCKVIHNMQDGTQVYIFDKEDRVTTYE